MKNDKYTEEVLREFDEIGFGNQARIVGTKRRELKDFLREKLTEAQIRTRREEIVICAAIKLKDGRIFRGHRHNDCLRAARGVASVSEVYDAVQGFITSQNRFVDRREAYNIAAYGNQVADEVMQRDLYSEDLY